MTEPPDGLLSYDDAMIYVRGFISNTRARDRFEDNVWGRWRKPPQYMIRCRTEVEMMDVGHPWLIIQRKSDKEQVSIEKVSEEPP